MSDFPNSIARVRAGECPVCGSRLEHRVPKPNEPVDNALWCEECEPAVGWSIIGVRDPLPEHGQVFGLGPMLVPSRRLTEDEARRIYSRPVEGDS